jgi:DNA-binding NarL/FixJ family response regulator
VSKPPDDEECDLGAAPPAGARVSHLEIGGQTVMVLSYPIEESDPLPETELSPAEIEVARLAIEGLSNAEIAARRETRIRTVANQMASILRKLDLTSRRELAARYPLGAPPRRTPTDVP